MIPGSGLIAAGRRTLGSIVLLSTLFVTAAIGTAAYVGGIRGALALATPARLTAVAILIAVLVLLWGLSVVATHASLRRYAHLGGPQRALSAVLVTGLIAVGVIPAARAADNLMILGDVMSSVLGQNAKSSGTTGKRPSGSAADPWAGTTRVNVLLIGSDAGADRTGVRPDTMIVASINTHTGETVLFSLPRNLQHVPFPAGSQAAADYPNGFYCINPKNNTNTECLLNAVWTFGINHPSYYPGSTNPGLTATVQAAEEVTGLKIDNYAMLNLRGFIDFVNAIGGVTVNVTEKLPIGGSVENPVAEGYIMPGLHQHLDGYHALWFARSRWSTSDYSRMNRQRCVIGAVVQQADPLKLATSFPMLAASAKKNISTDIALDDIQAWVDLALRVKGAHVRSLAFTDAVINTANPDFDKIHRLVQKAITPVAATPKPSGSSSSSATPTPTTTHKASEAQDVTTIC